MDSVTTLKAVDSLTKVALEMEQEDGQRLDMMWGAFKKLPVDVNGVVWGTVLFHLYQPTPLSNHFYSCREAAGVRCSSISILDADFGLLEAAIIEERK
jgi:hypothetical protein